MIEINNEALRLLKYDTLGFNLINGSKEEKEEPVKDLEEFEDLIPNPISSLYYSKNGINTKKKFL